MKTHTKERGQRGQQRADGSGGKLGAERLAQALTNHDGQAPARELRVDRLIANGIIIPDSAGRPRIELRIKHDSPEIRVCAGNGDSRVFIGLDPASGDAPVLTLDYEETGEPRLIMTCDKQDTRLELSDGAGHQRVFLHSGTREGYTPHSDKTSAGIGITGPGNDRHGLIHLYADEDSTFMQVKPSGSEHGTGSTVGVDQLAQDRDAVAALDQRIALLEETVRKLTSGEQVVEELLVRRLGLLDAEGRTRVVLHMANDSIPHAPQLEFHDSDGHQCLILGTRHEQFDGRDYPDILMFAPLDGCAELSMDGDGLTVVAPSVTVASENAKRPDGGNHRVSGG
jgi:hypothetical protein